jgi:hypothetical protein
MRKPLALPQKIRRAIVPTAGWSIVFAFSTVAARSTSRIFDSYYRSTTVEAARAIRNKQVSEY